MLKLAPYFAGGLVALVAMDFAPPVKSAIDVWMGASASASTVQAVNTVDRTLKGDRLVRLRPAASIGNSRFVNMPEVTIRAKAAKPVPARVQQPAVGNPKMPIGCDPAFSPLAASASLNFAGRCVS